jgi:hypothetical protein
MALASHLAAGLGLPIAAASPTPTVTDAETELLGLLMRETEQLDDAALRALLRGEDG